MSDPSKSLRRAIRDFDFRSMFINELGWDNLQGELSIPVDETIYRLKGVAQKRGLVVYLLETAEILPGSLRNKIETQVARNHREHILIFTDAAHRQQVWLWALREIGRPLARRSFEYHVGQSGEALAQRLGALAFTLDEEDDLTLVEVAGRVRAAFNVERATKKFYDQFKKERDAFETFVGGIPDVDMSKWYVSVMLNRLMFVYFIQKKGFLDGDPNYLRNRLAAMRATYGADQFDRFYRYFLLRLFHEGLGRPDHDPELEKLIGRVPYLNGGIFQLHQVEERYPDIQIPDAAFSGIFDFFDQYQWHLDDRPLRDDREINPDVLGYIFEKYINQKQMGAYYTKEDITEYISKNTIIPFLFDRAREGCAVAFQGSQSVWALPQADPDRYFYEAVRKGTELALPDDVAAGLEDVAARTPWNTPAPDEYALPTEIWRETIARRQRYEEIWLKLAGGEVRDINDFITYNLDIRQFAQDVVEQAEGPDLLAAFWRALTEVSVLDPTCGSGAFLFAALNVLEPLYEAAIARMREFMGDEGWQRLHPRYVERFGKVLADIERHPNETYYIQKAIIVNNLYGVDIMAEAVEIAKLRLFLKLASQVARVEDVEPLPDIDFNIRASNTLVGYVKREEVREALANQQVGEGVRQGRMIFGEEGDDLKRIEEKAADIDRLYGEFRAMQTGDAEGPPGDLATTKAEMLRRLAALNDELDRALARQYGVDPDNAKAFRKWRESHQPFHWFTEFYGILHGGGFNVVIGNPPYVEYSTVRRDYQVKSYATESCGNLYALVLERCENLLRISGKMGMIVQLPIVCTDRMKPLQDELLKRNSHLWFSNFDDRPARLFDGLEHIRATIVLTNTGRATDVQVFSTGYQRWYSEERGSLFNVLCYEDVDTFLVAGVIPKIGSGILKNAWERLLIKECLSRYLNGAKNHLVWFHNAPQYWIRAMDFAPYFWNERDGEKPSTQMKTVALSNEIDSHVVMAMLNSSTFYIWFIVRSDCRHLNLREIEDFPVGLEQLPLSAKRELATVGAHIVEHLQRNATRKQAYYKTTGQVEYDEFNPKASKGLFDQVDELLAKHYGFTVEELDYIINYDIKYRMGEELFAGDDDDRN
jgi:hypothetical protein